MTTASTEKLARENRRLRTALIALGAAVLGASAMGLADTPSRTDDRDIKPIGIATEGGFIYVLVQDGQIYRMEIAERERYNLRRPDFYHNNERFNWNRFVEGW